VKQNVAALLSGLLFAVGLLLSGMTQPAKVVGFLNFAGLRGSWDPSLALVMGGGAGVLVIAQLVARRLGRPLFASSFPGAPSRQLDARLVGGAAIFGIGWGLSGFCPGPAVVSLGGGTLAGLAFVPAMLVGMVLARVSVTRRERSRDESWGHSSSGYSSSAAVPEPATIQVGD
jgi:uncharacterized protein